MVKCKESSNADVTFNVKRCDSDEKPITFVLRDFISKDLWCKFKIPNYHHLILENPESSDGSYIVLQYGNEFTPTAMSEYTLSVFVDLPEVPTDVCTSPNVPMDPPLPERLHVLWELYKQRHEWIHWKLDPTVFPVGISFEPTWYQHSRWAQDVCFNGLILMSY